MNRRKFLGVAGAGVSAEICFPKLVSAIGNLAGADRGDPSSKACGSGHFGEWITDEFGLPAYRYTCDQLTDPHAQTPVHKEWIGDGMVPVPSAQWGSFDSSTWAGDHGEMIGYNLDNLLSPPAFGYVAKYDQIVARAVSL